MLITVGIFTHNKRNLTAYLIFIAASFSKLKHDYTVYCPSLQTFSYYQQTTITQHEYCLLYTSPSPRDS